VFFFNSAAKYCWQAIAKVVDKSLYCAQLLGCSKKLTTVYKPVIDPFRNSQQQQNFTHHFGAVFWCLRISASLLDEG